MQSPAHRKREICPAGIAWPTRRLSSSSPLLCPTQILLQPATITFLLAGLIHLRQFRRCYEVLFLSTTIRPIDLWISPSLHDVFSGLSCTVRSPTFARPYAIVWVMGFICSHNSPRWTKGLSLRRNNLNHFTAPGSPLHLSATGFLSSQAMPENLHWLSFTQAKGEVFQPRERVVPTAHLLDFVPSNRSPNVPTSSGELCLITHLLTYGAPQHSATRQPTSTLVGNGINPRSRLGTTALTYPHRLSILLSVPRVYISHSFRVSPLDLRRRIISTLGTAFATRDQKFEFLLVNPSLLGCGHFVLTPSAARAERHWRLEAFGGTLRLFVPLPMKISQVMAFGLGLGTALERRQRAYQKANLDFEQASLSASLSS